MKLMRSRFRLIFLLLTCVFLMTAVACAASALKQAGIQLPSVQQVLRPSSSPASEESVTVSPPASETDQNLPSEETDVPETDMPLKETDIPTDSEYNIFGL